MSTCKDEEKSFSTQPRLRIRRGHTIIIRRCYGIAKHLSQCGYEDNSLLTREELDGAVFHCAGGDYRTSARYIGRDAYTKPVMRGGVAVEPGRYIKHIKGYLERLHIISYEGNGKFRLNLGCVESFLSGEVSGASITNLCVLGKGAIQTVLETNENGQNHTTTTTHNTHTNQLSESILSPHEQAVLSIPHAWKCQTCGVENSADNFFFCRKCKTRNMETYG